MTANAAQFVGSIPQFYHEGLGPCVFAGYAKDMARRVAVLNPGDVLELAAGTGIVTGAMREVLRADAKLVATDLNTPMLDFARAKLRFDDGVEFRQADAMALPFNSGMFNVVVCQFGVMFFPDKARAFAEARRVLSPGGLYLFNVWDALEANDFALVATQATNRLFPDDPPTFFARVPHGYHDADVIRRALTEAGFANLEIETVEKRGRAPSPRAAAIGICQGTPLRNEIEARDAKRLDEATDVVAAALAAKFGSGAIEGRLRAMVVSAR